MIRTKNLLLEAYNKSGTIHKITEEEQKLLRERLCSMYIYLSSFCEERNLSIFVGYGTLLGAVRHKGFIPWDDDFDVMMPRADYNKLISDYSKELPEQYRIYAPKSKDGPICRFAKFVDITTRYVVGGGSDDEKHGIFIDIFPLENAASSKIHAFMKIPVVLVLMYIADSVYQFKSCSDEYKKLISLSKKLSINYHLRHFVAVIFSFLPARLWYTILDRVVQHRQESDYYFDTLAWSDLRGWAKLSKNIFYPMKINQFESIFVKTPNDSIALLEIWYKDWKRIPSEEERWQHFVRSVSINVPLNK